MYNKSENKSKQKHFVTIIADVKQKQLWTKSLMINNPIRVACFDVTRLNCGWLNTKVWSLYTYFFRDKTTNNSITYVFNLYVG